MFAVAPTPTPATPARTRPLDAPARALDAPVARLLTQAQVAWVLGWRSRHSVWRLRREDPSFPQPLVLAGALRWPESEVVAWAMQQPRVLFDVAKRRGNAKCPPPQVAKSGAVEQLKATTRERGRSAIPTPKGPPGPPRRDGGVPGPEARADQGRGMPQ